jgi:hypothetical protein
MTGVGITRTGTKRNGTRARARQARHGVRETAVDLGEIINVTRAMFRCPLCYPHDNVWPAMVPTWDGHGHQGILRVYEKGVRWECGHYRALPNLPAAKPNYFHNRNSEPKMKMKGLRSRPRKRRRRA